MKHRTNNINVTIIHFLSIVALVFGITFIGGCATGPSPEQLARVERERAEKIANDDAKRLKDEKEQMILLDRRNEVQSNFEKSKPAPENISKANEIVVTLNNAMNYKSKIFLLDNVTGKLIIDYFGLKKYSMMLRNIKTIRPYTQTSSLKILNNPEVKNTTHKVIIQAVDSKDTIICIDDGKNISWDWSVDIPVSGESTSKTIVDSLNDLAAIYKE